MAKLKKIMPPRMHRVVLAKTDVERVDSMPGDGNCLFAALAVGVRATSGKPSPDFQASVFLF